MRNRLVLVPDQARERAEEILIVDDDFVRVGANRRGDLARIVQFAEGALLERHRERLQRAVDHPRHHRGDRAAVETS